MTKFWLDFDKQIFTPMNYNVRTWPKFTTQTNINFPPPKKKNMLVQSALLLYKKKTSGMEVGRTLDVWLRFVSVIRLVNFNFGHVQMLRFLIVIFWSDSLGHLELVKWIFLLFCVWKLLYLIAPVFCNKQAASCPPNSFHWKWVLDSFHHPQYLLQ